MLIVPFLYVSMYTCRIQEILFIARRMYGKAIRIERKLEKKREVEWEDGDSPLGRGGGGYSTISNFILSTLFHHSMSMYLLIKKLTAVSFNLQDRPSSSELQRKWWKKSTLLRLTIDRRLCYLLPFRLFVWLNRFGNIHFIALQSFL